MNRVIAPASAERHERLAHRLAVGGAVAARCRRDPTQRRGQLSITLRSAHQHLTQGDETTRTHKTRQLAGRRRQGITTTGGPVITSQWGKEDWVGIDANSCENQLYLARRSCSSASSMQTGAYTSRVIRSIIVS